MTGRVVLDRTTLLEHASKYIGRKLGSRQEDAFVEAVSLAIERFLEGWEEFRDRESSRLQSVQDHIDRAIAAIIAETWRFGDDHEYDPFHDEESAFAWLQGNGENHDADEPGDFFDHSNNWMVRSLWNARQEIERQLRDLSSWDEVRWDGHWTRPPETASQFPRPLQEMIFDFCMAWHDFVDDNLKLPRRGSNPSNPLLRYLDYCLSIPLGEQRPPMKKVFHLVFDHFRPAIRAQADQELKEFDIAGGEVEFDPFQDD